MFRAQAELDNYRKRARRELDDERRYAEINLLRDLLPVLDNIHRAIDAAGKNADRDIAAGRLSAWCASSWKHVLRAHQCKPIEAGRPAVRSGASRGGHAANLPRQAGKHGTDVVQTGYQLHDRVVRPAQVVVSKKE